MVGWELASEAADLQAASKAKAMKLSLGSVLTKLQPIHMCHTNSFTHDSSEYSACNKPSVQNISNLFVQAGSWNG